MNKMRVIFTFLLVASLSACVNRKMTEPKPVVVEPGCVPDTVSFALHVQPIFTQNCAIPSCHSVRQPKAGLNLEAGTAYASITRPSLGYVDVANPRNSVLYNMLTSPANIMPPSGKMEDCKIEIIERWMGQGAKNN